MQLKPFRSSTMCIPDLNEYAPGVRVMGYSKSWNGYWREDTFVPRIQV